MSRRRILREVMRAVPLLHVDQDLDSAAWAIIRARVPALPVVDAPEKYVGIFGEREFIGAFFPAYLGELRYAAFVSETVDEALERRGQCAREPVAR